MAPTSFLVDSNLYAQAAWFDVPENNDLTKWKCLDRGSASNDRAKLEGLITCITGLDSTDKLKHIICKHLENGTPSLSKAGAGSCRPEDKSAAVGSIC